MKNNSEEIKKKAIALHLRYKGKLNVASAAPIKNMDILSLFYTPGVAAVSSLVAKDKKLAKEYTWKGRSVAVVSDGSAVLGLGNIGPEGALPVMEGKSVIFKEFGGVDAIPLVLDTQDAEKIIEIVKAIAPGFGGINLEDISAPRCFEIEERLKKELDIPVMHDDQHGTAIVVLAALTNALKVVKKKIEKIKIVISGAGPAGVATAKLLLKAGAKNILVLDSQGIISSKRKGLIPYKKELARITRSNIAGGPEEAIKGADVFIGLSRGNLLGAEDVKKMTPSSIIFAMANPVPEIMPDTAMKAGAAIVATGRSDFPNQINNSLVFPGVFRGALDNKVRKITDEMKLKAAHNLAGLVKKPRADKILPTMFEKGVVRAVARAIK